MSLKKQKQKLRLHNKTLFLGLMKKYRTHELKSVVIDESVKKTQQLTYVQFKKAHTPLLSLFYIFETVGFWKCYLFLLNYYAIYNYMTYYAKLVKMSKYFDNTITSTTDFNALNINNILIFSKPRRQIFLLLFKSKPIFVFTGGLMRMVMNEKRKSSKKLYKVAISLIRLSTILLAKKNFINSCYVKLINVGAIRTKILNSLSKISTTKIHYIIIKFPQDFYAQKFSTRRSIKKYVKKRFKLQ